MKSVILMSSLAAVVLASPAFAGPDRFETGTGCAMSSVLCAEQNLTNYGGKPNNGAASGTGAAGATSEISSGLNASTATQNTSLSGTSVSPAFGGGGAPAASGTTSGAVNASGGGSASIGDIGPAN